MKIDSAGAEAVVALATGSHQHPAPNFSRSSEAILRLANSLRDVSSRLAITPQGDERAALDRACADIGRALDAELVVIGDVACGGEWTTAALWTGPEVAEVPIITLNSVGDHGDIPPTIAVAQEDDPMADLADLLCSSWGARLGRWIDAGD